MTEKRVFNFIIHELCPYNSFNKCIRKGCVSFFEEAEKPLHIWIQSDNEKTHIIETLQSIHGRCRLFGLIEENIISEEKDEYLDLVNQNCCAYKSEYRDLALQDFFPRLYNLLYNKGGKDE